MAKKKQKIRWEALIISISLALTAGFFGSLVTTPSIPTWYATLNKPFFNPPNWVFGPVWTLLYILMGLSAYFIFVQHKLSKRAFCYYKLYLAQIALNFFWSLSFFGLKNISFSIFVILVLLYFIVVLIKSAHDLKVKISAYLLYPYLAWVSFATILNISIYMLN